MKLGKSYVNRMEPPLNTKYRGGYSLDISFVSAAGGNPTNIVIRVLYADGSTEHRQIEYGSFETESFENVVKIIYLYMNFPSNYYLTLTGSNLTADDGTVYEIGSTLIAGGTLDPVENLMLTGDTVLSEWGHFE